MNWRPRCEAGASTLKFLPEWLSLREHPGARGSTVDVSKPLHPDAANSLMLAVIESTAAPVLLLDGGCTIIAASAAFCRTFGFAPASVHGRELSTLGSGEWASRGLESLLRVTLTGNAEIEAYEMDLVREETSTRSLVLTARKLVYADKDSVRLLLTIADVTEARIAEKLKDDLLREKGILLLELQHRVANSLQIIASVLLQSAKQVQSEETRLHLHDAHHRVMSVAAVQKQLAVSRIGDVELRSYLTELCESIGASMIRDRDQISLGVTADDSVTSADISVSLGLIVTELVINALKHAFPGQRRGKISVDYASDEKSWKLSVDDDGVGMPADPKDATPGLGTSVVEALANQLDATVRVTDREPGTRVCITSK